MSRVALVLAGHGSHISAETAGVVWAYVDRLRRLGVADEVTAGFWKESPAFSQVLGSVAAEDVVVVPVFTAQGYFTQDVLPAEMGLTGALTRRGKGRIHLTPTVGEHQLLDAIVNTRLRDAIAKFGLQPGQTAAAIIGHGTPRNRNSRATARAQAERLRAQGWLKEAVAVYLDDEPAIPTVYRDTSSPNIIAMPYFLAEGSHVTRDVPRALGLSSAVEAEIVNGRQVTYCEPVGAEESICDVILALARDTSIPLETRERKDAWAGFPSVGRQTLLRALSAERILRFGQLMLSRQRAWRSGDSAHTRAIANPTALRTHLREASFRPLSTSADMPGGWHVQFENPDQAHAVLETVYPGLVAGWAAQQNGRLRIDTLETVSRRQVGMFKDIHLLPRQIIEHTVENICAACVCQPTWWQAPKTASAAKAELPCRAACNVWLSRAREMGESVA